MAGLALFAFKVLITGFLLYWISVFIHEFLHLLYLKLRKIEVERIYFEKWGIAGGGIDFNSLHPSSRDFLFVSIIGGIGSAMFFLLPILVFSIFLNWKTIIVSSGIIFLLQLFYGLLEPAQN
ncbi:MAG: hypothetical protein COV69_00585 [Parcubacteria group bacterium CG11_big_fil_rev_8_21_14_0_20_39_14]|nr:MAG: hypothetical protein COV69_00585 [Parcubacteria group bacterium CG11_big_fil_rev_8_21_14_0_20_39_14]PIS35387.1 MAG: hypothetical protein COT36_02630 [Parcubacteria group bacterium CG08_land_8_20_14_0_20_38_56]